MCYYANYSIEKSYNGSLTKSKDEYVSSEEKTNKLNDTVDQKDIINIGIIPSDRTGDNSREFVCFFPLFLMSSFLFLFCNICPEYFFRKRIKINKYRYINVEKKCGCNYVYEAAIEP